MNDPYTKLAQIVVNKLSSQEKEDKLISFLASYYYEFDSACVDAMKANCLTEEDLQEDE